MPTYRVGLIGCGRIGSEFEDRFPPGPSSIAGAFARVPECTLVAGCNRGEERLHRFGERWGVAALYTDYQDMLAAEALDIVAIATPPWGHRDQVVAAAEAGAKGIFCEKPMALSLGECDDMIAACQASGTVLLVNCTRRWGGDYEAIRRDAQAGRWGDLLHMVGFCQGCKPLPEWEAAHEGPLLHDAVHLYDLMRFFAGDVEWVQGSAERRRRTDLRVEDTSLATLQFASGVQGVAVVDELTEYSRFELELHFERGLVKVEGDFSARKAVPLTGTTETWWAQLAPDELPPPAWPEPGILKAAQDLVHCIQTGDQPRCTGADGRAAIEVIMALYESERRGRVRVDLPFADGRRMLDVLRDEGIY